MTYFGGEKAVPGYNVMGICKAALDSAVKYLAYDLGPRGIRVNACQRRPAAHAGRPRRRRRRHAAACTRRWRRWAATSRTTKSARTGAFLLSSDMSDGITGEILHVDCGYNIMGTPGRLLDEFKQVSATSEALERAASRSPSPSSSTHGEFLIGLRPDGCAAGRLLGVSRRQGAAPASRRPQPPCANAWKRRASRCA